MSPQPLYSHPELVAWPEEDRLARSSEDRLAPPPWLFLSEPPRDFFLPRRKLLPSGFVNLGMTAPTDSAGSFCFERRRGQALGMRWLALAAMFFVLGCSGPQDTASQPVIEIVAERVDGLETSSRDENCADVANQGFIDSDGDGVANCGDPTVFADDFSSGTWTGWEVVEIDDEPSSWDMSEGRISERSDAGRSIARGPDLGELMTYTVAVDTANMGGFNDEVGIVFAFDGADSYWIAKWRNPTGTYDWHSHLGWIELVRCEAGSCETLVEEEGPQGLTVEEGEWVRWSVTVNRGSISVVWRDREVLTYQANTAPVGPRHIGLWTYDNDGGVVYDNLAVTTP